MGQLPGRLPNVPLWQEASDVDRGMPLAQVFLERREVAITNLSGNHYALKKPIGSVMPARPRMRNL